MPLVKDLSGNYPVSNPTGIDPHIDSPETSGEFNSIEMSGNILPDVTASRDIGSLTLRFNTIYPSTISLLNSGTYFWEGRSRLASPANSRITISNNSGTDFDRLHFGGTSASFPALKRNAAALETKLSDDSAYAQHNAAGIGLADGITAPGATVGLAKIFVDAADGDLKVIFGDGVIKTIATDV